MNNIYESVLFSDGDGPPMHPGGLRLTDRAARLAALAPGMLAADIGCGMGTTAAFLTSKFKLRVLGLEFSEALIEAGLKRYPELALIRWDGNDFPLEDQSLDAALLECVLSVIGRPEAILRECARCLKADGKLILSDVVIKHGDANSGLFTAESLSELLQSCGFTVTVSEDHTPALRTYIAELRAREALDACALPGNLKGPAPKLSALGYTLFIARKK
jgi:ubiquinone/menaquinone biosynthesis C-methylase UbiE